MVEEELLALMGTRKGHFLFESGHHGDLWLDVDGLFRRPTQIQRFVGLLAARLRDCGAEVVCGPLTGGAFLAQMIASELDTAFCYAERVVRPERGGLYPVEYRIPSALRSSIDGRRVAVVDDVINAGSAVRGTLADLQAVGGRPVAIGALLILGSPAIELAAAHHIPLEGLCRMESRLWRPEDCPLCAAGVALEVR